MQLTAKIISALQLPDDKGDAIYFDDAMPGFGFRLRRSGDQIKRSWVVQYRRAGSSRRVTLGNAAVLSAAQAREEAKKVLGRVAIGDDPQAERRDRRSKDAHDFRAVAEEYLAAKEASLRPRSLFEFRRYLTGGYFKPLHGLPIDTITRKDIAARLVAIMRESSSGTAAHARTVVSAFFSWCMQMGYVEHNPVIGSVKPTASPSRARVLADAEFAAIWKACGDDEHGRIVRLLILTGARRQEIGGATWDELDKERGVWTLPGERSKNGRAHALPLPSAAWDIIGSVPRMASRDQLFGARAARGFTAWANGKADLDRRLGTTVAPFVVHDIRRSVATRMADIGIQPHVIEEILNHVSGHKAGIAGVYNRSSYANEVRAALALWADHVRSLVEGGERKIVSLTASLAAG